MATGKYGTQWLVSPEDLDQIKVFSQDDFEDLEGREGTEAQSASPAIDSPIATPDQGIDQGLPNSVQAELLEEDWEPELGRSSYAIETSGELAPVQAITPTMEQQALHQAGYWKGRWDEARERIIELEERQKAPAQLVEDLEASRQAEEAARLELDNVRAQLVEVESEKSGLLLELQRLRAEATEHTAPSNRSWWKRLLFKEVGR